MSEEWDIFEDDDALEDDFDEAIEGYCMSCRDSVEIENPQAVWTSQGQPSTRGTCPYCGGNVYRMGRTHKHDSLNRPDPIKVVDSHGVKRSSKAARIKIEAATYVVGSHGDVEIIKRIAEDLDKIGISAWRDSGDDTDTTQWAGGVHPALVQCKKMVVVLSQEALSNPTVEEAWRYFRDQRKPVFVVLAEKVSPPDDLRNRPRFDLSSDYKTGFRQLTQQLSS